MRKIIFAAVLMLPLSAQAEEKYEFCEAVAKLVETIAHNYQLGVSLSDTLAVSKTEAIRAVVVDIYSGPRFQTPDNQEREIARLRNGAHVQCLQQLKS